MNRKRVDDIFNSNIIQNQTDEPNTNNMTILSPTTENDYTDDFTENNYFVQSYSVDYDATDEGELSRSRGVNFLFTSYYYHYNY